jgi:predicted ATPase/class 3 adenylate cyclase
MAELPSGTVTFLFTDIEGSTRLWEEFPDAMRGALARHDAILRDGVAAHEGHVVKTTGDGIHAVFGTAHDAVDAAVVMQRGLAAESFGEMGRLRVRMGVHSCEAEYRDGDYYGGEVNRAARLMSVAHGDQIVVSLSTSALVRGGLVEFVDLGEHRLRDLTNRERIFQVSAPGLARDFPELRSLDSLPGNLPRQVTSFVGRDAEIAVVADLVRGSSLVTLTGVGGVGKTRLALQVAAEVVPHFRDGAWFAELAGVRDPEAVADALVAMFGLQPRASVSAAAALVEFLAGKELLLLLDNCEHVLRVVAGLVDAIARGCPGVRVLATSREGLNVAGERMLGVASLEVPSDTAGLGTIAGCDAVVLFVERARAVKASFALDATNAGAVAQVCRRLDGIALAIELAAARVAMLTPAEVAQRLDQRFRLLASGQRTTVERHQTLRAAIDWSYELLGETEQLLLARLSVFAGGFSLDAVEVVTVGGAVETNEVFELLATLVSRSLVIADTDGVETRYRLLETIRQYAQEHLDDSGDGDRLRAAHGAYFAVFAELAIPNAVGPDGIEWERRVQREFDNIRAALIWATETGDLDTAIRLLAVWDAPAQFPDPSLMSTARWASDTVLARPEASEHPKYPAALGGAGFLAWAEGDQDLARRRCDEALAAEERLGSSPSIGIWNVLTQTSLAEGHATEAVEHAQRAVALARGRGEPASLAQTLATSALAQALAGDPTAALPAAEEAVVLIHRLANPHVLENALAMAAFALGDSEPERALALAREAVALSAPGEPNAACGIAGYLAARQGDRRAALTYYAEAIDTMHWMGNRTGLGAILGSVATLLPDRDPEATAVLLGAGDALAPGYSHATQTVEARTIAIATVDASLGTPRRHELHAQGMTLNDADAATYANAAILRSLADETI